MISKPNITQEPVRITTAATAAVIATINVFGIVFEWPGDTIAALNIAGAAWVGVGGAWLRSKVTPTQGE